MIDTIDTKKHDLPVPESDQPVLACSWQDALHVWWGQLWRGMLLLLVAGLLFRCIQLLGVKPTQTAEKCLSLFLFITALIWATKRSLQSLLASDVELSEPGYSEVKCGWQDTLRFLWAQGWRAALLSLPFKLLAFALAASHPQTASLIFIVGGIAGAIITIWATKMSIEVLFLKDS
jgi:hypothetical protein